MATTISGSSGINTQGVTSSGTVSGATVTSSGTVSGATVTSSGTVSGTTVTSSGTVSGTTVTSSGDVNDTAGDVRQAPVTAVTSTPYTVPSGSSGKLFRLAINGGTVNVNVANFNQGDVVTLVNITSGTVTLSFDAWGNGVRIAGGDATNYASSTLTLAAHGVATLIAMSSNRLYVNGNVS